MSYLTITNNRISKLYHELLEIIPYNAFVEKLREYNIHWYIGKKLKRPTLEDVKFAILFNVGLNVLSISDLKEDEIIYIGKINDKLHRIMYGYRYNGGVNYFRVRIKYDANSDNNYIKIYFLDNKNGNGALHKRSCLILTYKFTNQCAKK